MNTNKKVKEQICNKLQEMLGRKVEIAIRAIESAKEARDNDTKSSAGDKYETGRAMMQIELEKNEVQLSRAINLQKELSRINTQKEYNKVEFGSLVVTNQGAYFISIGIGKIEVNNENYYSISLASPIGKLLKDKIVGDRVQFQGREFTIRDIV